MTQENAKWELEILLKQENELLLNGRNIEYTNTSRIKALRDFLDKAEEPIYKETIKISKDENDGIPY